MKIQLALVGVAAAGSLLLAGCGGGEETVGAGDGVAADYPLKVCVVSGEELGSMGEPYKLTHEGTTVLLCCEPCEEEFNEDPAKYLAKLKEAESTGSDS